MSTGLPFASVAQIMAPDMSLSFSEPAPLSAIFTPCSAVTAMVRSGRPLPSKSMKSVAFCVAVTQTTLKLDPSGLFDVLP